MNEKRLPNEQEGVKKDQGMGREKQGEKQGGQGGSQQGQEKIGQQKPGGGDRDINR